MSTRYAGIMNTARLSTPHTSPSTISSGNNTRYTKSTSSSRQQQHAYGQQFYSMLWQKKNLGHSRHTYGCRNAFAKITHHLNSRMMGISTNCSSVLRSSLPLLVSVNWSPEQPNTLNH